MCDVRFTEKVIPQDVYDTYINYNKNQELFITKIEKAEELIITKDIIEELVFNKYNRNIDRMKLNLRMNMKSPTPSESETSSTEESDSENVSDEIDVNLVKLNKWLNDETLVGRMVNCLYEYEESVTFEEFKEAVV